MKALTCKQHKGLPVGAEIPACDNSGAKVVKMISVMGHKTVRKRIASGAVGDLCTVSVIKGKPDMRNKVVLAVVVRQRKEYRRPDGSRIKFEDNAVVVLKDNKGNPKGTIFKGAIAKEAAERWPGISKVARIIS